MSILHPFFALHQQINLTAWEYRTSGTVRGAPGNRRSYRETRVSLQTPFLLTIKGQLVKAKLELYKPVIQSYQQYIKAIYPLTQQVQTKSLAKLNDLEIEMVVLASSPVMDAHHKLHNALGSHQDENLALLLPQLIKGMCRDLGHGVDYGKSRQEFLGAAEPAGNDQHPSHGVN